MTVFAGIIDVNQQLSQQAMHEFADIFTATVPERYTRPTLGISIDDDINKKINVQLDIQVVAILDIKPNSPAFKTKLQSAKLPILVSFLAKSFIQSINGRPITNVKSFLSEQDNFESGEAVAVGVFRNDTRIEIETRLEWRAITTNC